MSCNISFAVPYGCWGLNYDLVDGHLITSSGRKTCPDCIATISVIRVKIPRVKVLLDFHTPNTWLTEYCFQSRKLICDTWAWIYGNVSTSRCLMNDSTADSGYGQRLGLMWECSASAIVSETDLAFQCLHGSTISIRRDLIWLSSDATNRMHKVFSYSLCNTRKSWQKPLSRSENAKICISKASYYQPTRPREVYDGKRSYEGHYYSREKWISRGKSSVTFQHPAIIPRTSLALR